MSGQEHRGSQQTANVSFRSDTVGKLSSHEVVTELLLLMKESGQRMLAVELSHMVSSVDNMDKKYCELLSTVRGMGDELAELVEQSYAPTEERPDLSMYQETQNEAARILAKIAASKEKIIVCAKSAVKDCEQMGMDRSSAFLLNENIRGTVRTLRKQSNNSALNIIDIMLRAEKEGKIQSALLIPLRPMRATQKLMSHVSNLIRGAFGGAEHLTEPAEATQKAHIEQTTQKSRVYLKDKPSIRQALKKNQTEIAANSIPIPDKEKNKEATL